MAIGNDIKSYIVKEGYTLVDVTEELNRRNNTNHCRANLSKKLNKDSIRADEMIEIADIIGYDIVWVKRNT